MFQEKKIQWMELKRKEMSLVECNKSSFVHVSALFLQKASIES